MNGVYKTTKCICEKSDMSNWSILKLTTVKSGKQFGKRKAIVYCNKCGHQWETTAQYIDKIK